MNSIRSLFRCSHSVAFQNMSRILLILLPCSLLSLKIDAQNSLPPADKRVWDLTYRSYNEAGARGDFRKMQSEGKRLIEIAQKSGDFDYRAAAHLNQGNAFSAEVNSLTNRSPERDRECREAIAQYTLALEFRERAQEERIRQAVGLFAHSAKAQMHYLLDEADLAETHWKLSLVVAKETGASQTSGLLKNLGSLSMSSKASPAQKKRLTDYFALESRAYSATQRWTEAAWCDYYTLSSLSPLSAISHLQKLVLSTERFDKNHESEVRMSALHVLSLKLNEAGLFESTLSVCDLAEEVYSRSLSAPFSDAPSLLAECRNNKAVALLNLGDFKTALREFDHALSLRTSSAADISWNLVEKNKRLAEQCLHLLSARNLSSGEAQKLVNQEGDLLVRAGMALRLGGELREEGRFKEANLLFLNAQKQLRNQSSSPQNKEATSLTGIKHLFLGTLQAEGGQWKEASESLEKSRQELLAFEQDNALSFCLPLLAVARAHSGQKQNAEHTFTEAVARAEARQALITAPEHKGMFQGVRAATLYADYAHFLSNTRGPEAALLMAERGRGRGMAYQAVRVLAKSAKTVEEKEALTSRWLSEVSGAELKALTHGSPDTLFLHYNLSREGVTLFAFGEGLPVHYWVIDRDVSMVLRSLDLWVKTLVSRGFQSSEKRIAQKLGLVLLSPLYKANLLKSGDRQGRWKSLAILPDGGLHNLPFAALLLPEPGEKRLLDRFPISLSSSLRQRLRNVPPGVSTRSLLVVSNPTGEKEKRVKSRQMAGGLETDPALPEFDATGSEVVKRWGKGGDRLSGKQAKRDAVLAHLPDYALLLFLTHGHASEERAGLASYLSLAPDVAGGAPKHLEAEDIAALPLSAKLTVLLACETAQGRLAGGEGTQGLVWAFWAAGCPSVVASLWESDSRAASALLPLFLENVKNGLSKDVALQKAALRLRRQFPDPKDWAAFQLYGDPGALTGKH